MIAFCRIALSLLLGTIKAQLLRIKFLIYIMTLGSSPSNIFFKKKFVTEALFTLRTAMHIWLMQEELDSQSDSEDIIKGASVRGDGSVNHTSVQEETFLTRHLLITWKSHSLNHRICPEKQFLCLSQDPNSLLSLFFFSPTKTNAFCDIALVTKVPKLTIYFKK